MTSKIVPEEFVKVTTDFVNDLMITFPEYIPFINKWWDSRENLSDNKLKTVYEHCAKKLPARFFDILYQNEDMFKAESEIDTEFFPKIHFKNLWQYDISQKTRDTIWKYLQLLLFSIVGTLDNKDAFGETAKLFEAINADEFKNKLQETLLSMQSLFDCSNNTEPFCKEDESNKEKGEKENEKGEKESKDKGFDLPDAEKINEHISSMMDGKIGKLAREIAEETAEHLNIDFDESSDVKDVFNTLIKNPTKLMGIIKNFGDKLDVKLKSGELKESEMIQEATEIMNKLKNIPGMGNMQSMLSKMGMGGLSGLGGKVNTGAMEAQLNQRLKMAKTKERIRAKAEANAIAKANAIALANSSINNNVPQEASKIISEEELIKIFSSGDKFEKTPRGSKSQHQPQSSNKKKKGKK